MAPSAQAGATPAPAIPDAEQILAVPAELAEQLKQRVTSRGASPLLRLELLTRFIFDDSGLGIRYRHDADYTVAQTYRTREANCLSFTLLTVALARAAGLEAYGQHVADALSWHSENERIVRSSHVNAGIRADGRRFSVDVAVDSLLTDHPPARITDRELIALYYSNLAVAALMAGELPQARALMTQAQQHGPELAQVWGNAGVLHAQDNDQQAAESAYLRAVALAPGDSTSLVNLAALYRRIGEDSRASDLERRASRILASDPLHQFQRALEAEQRRDFSAAVKHFRRAIRLHPTESRFHLGLARSYLALSDERRAAQALARAVELGSGSDQARYQAKLESLRSHRNGCCDAPLHTPERAPTH